MKQSLFSFYFFPKHKAFISIQRTSTMPIISVAAMIINDGKILMTRSEGKEMWSLPTSQPKPGEDYLACLIRWLSEKMGIKPTKTEFYSSFRDMEDFTGEPLSVHCYFVTTEDKPKMANGTEFRWVTKSDFLDSKIRVIRSLQKQVLPALIIEGHM
jgi:ADP-ribose pyrophosphatase YjhB (NUDIX family)